MLMLPPSVRIYVATERVDARTGFNGLSARIDSHFGHSPLEGHIYVFLNRRGDHIQMIYWDRNGYVIVKKRLEAGTFRLTRSATGELTHVEVNPAELVLMLEGIELQHVKQRKRFRLTAPSEKTSSP